MRNESSNSVRIWSPHWTRDDLIAHLRARVRELARLLPVRRAVLFGSWARGRATARSDVDVLVIYADPPRADAHAVVWRALRTPGLEPHVYAESEAASIQETLERMTAGGIDLLDSPLKAE
uniref:Nucleotidyltransferase domain-containing protein n=1 Tax=Thermomicrobium roseum TaxID=500 RepID=A0A7C5VYT9_THERO